MNIKNILDYDVSLDIYNDVLNTLFLTNDIESNKLKNISLQDKNNIILKISENHNIIDNFLNSTDCEYYSETMFIFQDILTFHK